MMHMNRFLALIPVVAFTAACNGSMAPTGSSPVISNDEYQAADQATAMKEGHCKNLARISLTPVTSPLTPILWVDAAYHFTGTPRPCEPPRWTSDRGTIILDPENAMRAGIARLSPGRVTITATAPNRMTHSIVVDLGRTEGSDGNLTCGRVTGVDVRILPVSTSNGEVALQATYRYDVPVVQPCTVAPIWTASRSGLKVHPYDPFRAAIARKTDVRTTVKATAPNGVFGQIIF
jgi:hypothetical protein